MLMLNFKYKIHVYKTQLLFTLCCNQASQQNVANFSSPMEILKVDMIVFSDTMYMFKENTVKHIL